MKKHQQEKFGELLIGLQVLFQAFWPVGAHYGATQMPQIQFLAYITLLSSVLFLGISLYKREFKSLWNKKILLQLSAYTLLSAVLPYGIIVYATRYSSAIETTLLTQSEVIFAALFAWIFLKEKISANKLFGISSILLANSLILYSGGLNFNWANLALFFAPLLFVLANSIAKNLQKEGLSWSLILSFRMTVGGLILLIFAHTVEGLQVPAVRLLPFLFLFTFFVFGLGKILWQMALHRLDLSKVTALGVSSPAISLLIAFLWLGEIPSNVQWLGILFVGVGTLALLKTHSKQWVELD